MLVILMLPTVVSRGESKTILISGKRWKEPILKAGYSNSRESCSETKAAAVQNFIVYKSFVFLDTVQRTIGQRLLEFKRVLLLYQP